MKVLQSRIWEKSLSTDDGWEDKSEIRVRLNSLALDYRNVVRRQFGQHAEEYRKSRTHSDPTTLDSIVRLISPRGEEEALDVGCGGGHMATALAPLVHELVAIDLAPQMLFQTSVLAGEKGISNVRPCLADVQSLPFSSEAFDIVACRIVLHHVLDAGKAVAEMGRVLKGGGKLFIQDILGADDRAARDYMDVIERLRDPSHIKDYDMEEWNCFLESGGLEVLHTETIPRVYRLKEWTSRSGTPVDKVEEIVMRLHHMPEEVRRHLKALPSDGDWSIPMRYLLVLATRAE